MASNNCAKRIECILNLVDTATKHIEHIEKEWLGIQCLASSFRPVLTDTAIYLYSKHVVSHVAIVCACGQSSRTSFITCVFLVNLTTLFVDGNWL